MAVSISERISVQKELHGRVRFVQGIPKTATGKGKIQHNSCKEKFFFADFWFYSRLIK
jgi:hypothetical protein